MDEGESETTSTTTTGPARKGVARTLRLNQKAIDALPPHDPESPSRETEYSDDDISGLKLMVGKTGKKTYYLRYTFDRRKRAYRIGEHGPFSVADARKEAHLLRAKIARGIDPQAERTERRTAVTFEEFAVQEYVPHSRTRNRAWKHNEYKVKNYLIPRWGRKRLADITTLDVQRMMDELREGRAPATANRYFSVVHRIFHLAVLWGRIEKNPATGVPKFKENNKRERYLAGEELKRYLSALENEPNPIAAGMIKFLLLTGVRLGEAVGARWSHIDIEKAQLWLPQTKAGSGRWVLLNEAAVALLKNLPRAENNDVVFTTDAGTPLRRIDKFHHANCKRAGIENLRVHDLRHSFASAAINAGATLYEVQHLLGHLTSVTTSRYAHLADSTLRRVSQEVGRQVSDASAKPQAAIVELDPAVND